MSLSRRKFLRAGTLVAVSAGIPLRTLAAETFSQPSPLLANNGHLNAGLYLNRETFSRYLNTKFSLSHDAEAIAVRSIQVNDWTPKAGRASAAATGRECFSVVFIGSHSVPLRQETYTVTHDSIGKFAMLVVPVGKDKEGVYYEAVFNRLH